MDVPAIKGTAFASVADDVGQLRESGVISEEQLEQRLEAEDFTYLDEKVLPGSWVPLDTYARLSELLLDVEGNGDPDYIVRRGAVAAQRIFDSGLYRQLTQGEERAQEMRQMGEAFGERDGTRIATLAGAIFNVSRWSFEVDSGNPGTFRIRVSEAEALPEVSRHAAQGFIGYIATRLTAGDTVVTSERTDPDQILFLIRGPAP